jgi:hypothetical protein
MSLRTFKTNRLLWLALSLICFLFWFYGIDHVFALFSGCLRIDDLLRFEFVAPVMISVVVGWLLQCALVIVISWKRGRPKPKQ